MSKRNCIIIGIAILLFSYDFVLSNTYLAISMGGLGLCLVVIGALTKEE